MTEMFYLNFRKVGRTYLDLLQLKDSIDKRLASIEVLNPSSETIKLLKQISNTLNEEKKHILQVAQDLFSGHNIWKWCKNVSGMGPVAALTFLSYINPYKTKTAGQARAYFGIAPQSKLESGVKANFNPEAKGRLFLIVRNIIMKRDDYYYQYYKAKKEYYLAREFNKYLKNPGLCPSYKKCIRRLQAKAARLNREPKALPCKLHLDNLAKR